MITFHENPSSGSRGIPCGQADGNKLDMTKETVAFRSFANAYKNVSDMKLVFHSSIQRSI